MKTTDRPTHSDQRQIPSGWRVVRLDELIAEAQTGFASGKRDPEGVAQLRMNNVGTRGNFVWDEILRVPADEATIDQYRLIPGDVMFNNTNSVELVGKSALFENYVEPFVFSNHFTRLRTRRDVLEPAFLAAWLNHQWLKGVFANICNRWVGQSAVKADRLLRLNFLLPPLSEQQRVVRVLREQMAAVDKARAAAEARLEAVNALPAALLRQVFPQPGQRLPEGWRWVKLGEVCELNPRRPTIERHDNAPTSFIPMEAVDAMHGIVTDQRVRPFGEIKKGYTYFAEGDVLFAKITPCMQNGKHAIAQGLIGGIGFGTTEVHVLRPSKSIMSEWVHFFVRQPAFLLDATEHFTGAVGQQRLPAGYLASREIALPPLSEQRRIVKALQQQMRAVDKARAASEVELESINALPAALLRRAFNGEL